MPKKAGEPSDVAKQSFQVAETMPVDSFRNPPGGGTFRLSDEYVTIATQDVARQLIKAGVRLCVHLNEVERWQ